MPAPEGRPGDGRDRRCALAPTRADVVCDVSQVVDPDVGVLDVLARMQLVARRTGRRLVLRGVGDRLRELLELAGLDDVLRCSD